MSIIETNYQNQYRKELLAILKNWCSIWRTLQTMKPWPLCTTTGKETNKRSTHYHFLLETGFSYHVFGAKTSNKEPLRKWKWPCDCHRRRFNAGCTSGIWFTIGGVLATNNVVISYGVGVDIGCRMAMSIYDIPADHLLNNEHIYKRELIAWTKFGAGSSWQGQLQSATCH